MDLYIKYLVDNKESKTRNIILSMFGEGDNFNYLIGKMYTFAQCSETGFYDTYNKELSLKMECPFRWLAFNHKMYVECKDIFDNATLYERN